MADICTNLTAFFHTEQGCFSINHHTCTYTPWAARGPPKVLDLFTAGGRMPLSPPPLTISVLRAVRNTTAAPPASWGGRGPSSEPPPLPPPPSLTMSSHFFRFPGVYENRREGLCSELPLTRREGQPLFVVDVVVCDHANE